MGRRWLAGPELGRARPSFFHVVSRGPARPTNFSEEGPRPGPAHYFSDDGPRPSPARPVIFSKDGPRAGGPVIFSADGSRPIEVSTWPGPVRLKIFFWFVSPARPMTFPASAMRYGLYMSRHLCGPARGFTWPAHVLPRKVHPHVSSIVIDYQAISENVFLSRMKIFPESRETKALRLGLAPKTHNQRSFGGSRPGIPTSGSKPKNQNK